MIHSNRHNHGFTLIEILVALFIASGVLVPIFILQGKILKTVNYYSSYLQANLSINNLFSEQRLETLTNQNSQQIKLEKKLDNPSMYLQYECNKIPRESSLNKLDHIYLEKVTARWTDLQGPQEEIVISCIFKPNQQN